MQMTLWATAVTLPFLIVSRVVNAGLQAEQ
jgi:hypothetical protein